MSGATAGEAGSGSAGSGPASAGRLEWLARTYATVDARALAAFRIAFGLLCFLDFARRWPWVEMLLTEPGAKPPLEDASQVTWSLLIHGGMSDGPWPYLLLAGAMLASLAFAAGALTRTSQLVTWACMLSVNSTVFPMSNSGGRVLHLMLMWALFLPVGRAWSVDAWRRTGAWRGEGGPVRHLAVTALLAQIATIYLFGAVEKWGQKWGNGEAIYYLLQLDTHVTALGLAVRDGFPMWLSQAGTYLTLFAEFSIPLLLFSPWRAGTMRRLAAVLIVGLHGGIALLCHVGLFSYVMMALSTLLLWPAPEEAPAGPRVPALRWAATSVVALLMALNTLLALQSNDTTRTVLGLRSGETLAPESARPLAYAINLTQRWRLFAPDVPAAEGKLVVDARTTAGERVDPLNGGSPDFGPVDAATADYPQFLRKLSRRVSGDGSGRWATALAGWLQRTWHGAAPLETVDVWWVYDKSPEPGESGPPKILATVHQGGVGQGGVARSPRSLDRPPR